MFNHQTKTEISLTYNLLTLLRKKKFDEGENIIIGEELSDSRSIWDQLKYNIRAYTIWHSKIKAGERNEREQKLGEEYAKAKHIFETDPNDRNANIFNPANYTLKLFYEQKVKGTSTARSRKVPKIF